jgi:hypothetical protein
MSGRKLEPVDLFAMANGAILLAIVVVWSLRGALAYRGPANLVEFSGYALVIALLGLLMMRVFHGRKIGAGVIALTQAGVLAHFLGGFVAVHGARLYDAVFLGLGFDKYVHVLNGLAGAALTEALIARRDRAIVQAAIVFLVVMGAGAIVELIEYGAYRLVPDNGVGGYDNNMQDMLANSAGAILYLLCHFALASASSSGAAAQNADA